MVTSSFLAVVLAILVVTRICFTLRKPRAVRKKARSKKCCLAVFLGSGGHTAEAITLISALDFARYAPRIYIISEGDRLSVYKINSLELTKSTGESESSFSILTVPRARRVHQSLVAAVPSAILSLMKCTYLVAFSPLLAKGPSKFADVLLVNGPGTCVFLCVGVFIAKIIGLQAPQIIYVESFARVHSLSLSGRLLRPLVDRFVVQWPHIKETTDLTEYHGWLI